MEVKSRTITGGGLGEIACHNSSVIGVPIKMN